MPDIINIAVENKIATKTDSTEYVCNNSVYVVKFAFDAEWDAYDTKTARFSYNGRYIDIVFTGTECHVPIISDTYFFNIGVYAGNLHTTTPAIVPCKKSILCGGEPESPASQEVREEVAEMEKLAAEAPAPEPTEEERIAALEKDNAELRDALDALISGVTA